MSSNALTVVEPVESTKKFKFHTEKDPEKIEITIPEVNDRRIRFDSILGKTFDSFRL